MNGMLAKRFCKVTLPLQVCKSYAGFYIGTMEEGMPYSRESVDYWETHGLAQAALDSGNWTQKMSL